MLIQQKDNGKTGSFFVQEGESILAEMVYTWNNDEVFTIVHTEVNEQLEGKGVGKQLVNAAVEYARVNAYKIIPRCSFAAKVFDKVEAYSDVLYKE